MDQRFREAEMPVTPGGRIESRKRNLTGDPAPTPRGRYARGGIGRPARRVQRGRSAGLTRRCSGFQSFQLGDALDQRRFLGGRIDDRKGFEHVCDTTSLH